MPRSGASSKATAAAENAVAAMIGRGAQGAELARALVAQGITTRAHLKRPDVISRLPRDARASVLFNPVRRIALPVAQAISDEACRRLSFSLGGRARQLEVIPVGGVRRESAVVKDIDLLVVVPGDAAETTLATARLRAPRPGDSLSIVDTYAAGSRRRSFILEDAQSGKRYKADLFVTTAREKAYALYHHTGSAAYNIRIRAFAKRQGWKLNQYGLFVSATGHPVPRSTLVKTEAQLAKLLGVTFREPRDRT
jgi:DNA polymerase/3'-5' exonuclease PolX